MYILIIERCEQIEARLQKWGNSDGIRIPSNLLKSLNLKTNDKVEIIQQEDKIIISKSENKHLTFEERLRKYNGDNIVENYDWGEAKGKEIW